MNNDKKSESTAKLGAILTWVAILCLAVWAIDWLIQRKWGAIFIIWVLWFWGAMIILGAALALITGDANLADQGWPWLLFGVAAAVMTGVQFKRRFST
jgi:drug/metabolite transporter (DMT)-like permease